MTIHASKEAGGREGAALTCPDCDSVKVLTTDLMADDLTSRVPEEVGELLGEYEYYCMSCYSVFDT